MSENEGLQEIVEAIGALSDKAEADKWAVASAISAAYQELPLYSRGLTSGLCLRLKKSEDSIYNLRNAENLRAGLRYNTDSVTVSHFSTLYHLRDRFRLTDADCVKWLDWVKETGASVREMSMEVSIAHTQDARAAFLRRCGKVAKSLMVLYQDSESVGLPQPLRIVLKSACEGLGKVLEWGS